MIPKIIHYCWFGNKPKTTSINKYIDTWKKHMPNYVIKEWNENNFDVSQFRFTQEAYSVGKYAFVSDVVRLYALAHEGGIYFDTDIEVLKSFDALLDQDYILGYEKGNIVGTGVMAAVKGSTIIQGFLETYKNKSFILKDGSQNNTPNPQLLMDYIQHNKLNLKIYDVDYFCAKDFLTGKIVCTNNTYCIHHYVGSWLTPWQKIKKKIHYLLGY